MLIVTPPSMFAKPAPGAWPWPFTAKLQSSVAAMIETARDASSGVDGYTMHPGLSPASCKDQYELSVALYVDWPGKLTFVPSCWDNREH